MELKKKIVLVAGGTGGLGRSVTLAFLNAGAEVAVTFRNEAELEELRRAAGDNSSRLTGHEVDVTDENESQKLVEELVRASGGIDVLVNTVGAYAGGVPAWMLDSETFERMLSLNLRSAFALVKAVVPRMLKQKHGSIINIASKAAVDHAAGAAAYVASKAAAVAFVESLAADLKGSGVRANSILPSIIDTPMNRRFMPDANFAIWPKPEQIAKVILFLSSDEGQVIHGASIPVYGDS